MKLILVLVMAVVVRVKAPPSADDLSPGVVRAYCEQMKKGDAWDADVWRANSLGSRCALVVQKFGDRKVIEQVYFIITNLTQIINRRILHFNYYNVSTTMITIIVQRFKVHDL